MRNSSRRRRWRRRRKVKSRIIVWERLLGSKSRSDSCVHTSGMMSGMLHTDQS